MKNEYRFKTKDELLLEFGVHWRTTMDEYVSFIEKMDLLLGTKIPGDLQKSCETYTGKFTIIHLNKSFTIIKSMYTKVSPIPNYKPKQLKY